MNNLSGYRENYPPGFNGIEGEDEKEHSFYIQGEPTESNCTREEALEDLRSRTIRELEADGHITIE